MGYRPNGAAALLAKQRRHDSAQSQITVSLITPTVISNRKFYAHSLERAFITACEEQGMQFQPLKIDPEVTLKSLLRNAWHQGIEGICLDNMESVCSPEAILSANWQDFAVVQSHRHGYQPFFDTVTPNPFDFMYRTLEQVYAKGYRHLAIVLSRSGVKVDDQARLGAIRAFEEIHCDDLQPVALKWCEHPHTDKHQGSETCRWLQRQHPEAVVVFPFSWYYVLQDFGFRFPRDMGLATPMAYSGLMDTADLSGCDASEWKIGRLLSSRLRQLLEIGQKGMPNLPLQNVISPDWLEGETLPHCRFRKVSMKS